MHKLGKHVIRPQPFQHTILCKLHKQPTLLIKKICQRGHFKSHAMNNNERLTWSPAESFANHMNIYILSKNWLNDSAMIKLFETSQIFTRRSELEDHHILPFPITTVRLKDSD